MKLGNTHSLEAIASAQKIADLGSYPHEIISGAIFYFPVLLDWLGSSRQAGGGFPPNPLHPLRFRKTPQQGCQSLGRLRHYAESRGGRQRFPSSPFALWSEGEVEGISMSKIFVLTAILKNKDFYYHKFYEALSNMPNIIQYEPESWLIRWSGAAKELASSCARFVAPGDEVIVVPLPDAAMIAQRRV